MLITSCAGNPRMTQLVLRALFIGICIIVEGFFFYVIQGMLRELKRSTTLKTEQPDALGERHELLSKRNFSDSKSVIGITRRARSGIQSRDPS